MKQERESDTIALEMLKLVAMIDAKKHEMNSLLKDGHLLMSQAKMSMGHHKLSKFNYNQDMDAKTTACYKLVNN